MGKSILGIIIALFAFLSAKAEQPTFNISSTDAMPGETIEVDFEVDNFIDIISVQYSVNWNPAVLEFKSLKNFNADVPGLSPSVFGTPQALLDQGKFTLAWIESSITPITIPDGSLFFTVEFEVVGTECQTSAVEITDDPLEIEVAEEGEVPVGLIANNGLVSIPGTGCSENIQFIGNSVIGACGSTTCIEFTVANFITVGAMEFSLSYDPNVLEFDEFRNFAPLTGFGAGNTNLLVPGTLRVLWFDSNVENDTLPDGTVLFEICFDVIGTGGQSSEITFGDNPPPAITDIDGNPHEVTITPAEITAQCALEGFALIADSMCTMPGEIVCFNVTINDFEDLIALQFSMNWDSNVFVFDHLEAFGIPGLDESGFGTPGFLGVKEGQLAVSWIDLSLDGVTLPDGATIFRLCLEAVGNAGTSSPITFSAIPLEIEIATLDSTLEYTLVQGFGEIQTVCDGPCPLSYTLTPTPPSCPGACDASINLEVMDCPETPTFMWSNGETTEDLSDLCAGTYIVTITLGEQLAIAMTTISDPMPVSVTASITDPVPPGSNTGSVDITVSGGCMPYTYLWSNGAVTEDLTNVGPGVFTVTVTDCSGCAFTPEPYVVGAELILAVQHVSCFGGTDGAINLSVAFGTGPYTYMWNTNPVQTTEDISNLVAGQYCVTVTDSGGSTRDTCVTVNQPNAIVLSASIINDINEDCMGAIDLNVVGGVMPNSYLWSNGATTQDITGLCQGQYCVTVTDGQGCQSDTCFNVFSGDLGVSLTASEYGDFNVSCNGACDGEITSEVFGPGTFTYLWSNGATTPDLMDVCAGMYSLTVTDEGGRTAVASFEMLESDPFALAYVSSNPTDFTTSDGDIAVIVNGGVPPYLYQWSGPVSGNTASLTNVPAGTYTIVITDANGCQITDTEQLLPDLDVPCQTAMSVITPNSDGKNDFFIISCVMDFENTLTIYNRYGGLVYEVDNYQNDWSGYDNNNEPVPDGGYMWVLQITRDDGSKGLFRGTVNLLRSAD